MFNIWLASREKGQGLLEYALIIALIIIVVIAVMGPLGKAIADIYQQIVGALGG
jgi:pilus assembly protein Flp/PilA